MVTKTEFQHSTADSVQFSALVNPKPLAIGAGFKALSFKEPQFAGIMDPLVMVDHYTMTEPTFGPHPHAGMSAVSILFEDSQGSFNNRDSLGHDIDLQPGDVYWLNAGRGALHDEAPRAGAKTHGLQLFVNLPARLKNTAPASLHVAAADIPLLQAPGYRVRILTGASQGVTGASVPALPVTMLDGQLEPAALFTHSLGAEQSAWLYPVSGDITLKIDGETRHIPQGRAMSLRNEAQQAMALEIGAASAAHFVLIAAEPVRESFVQRGPFVMSTLEELERVNEAYTKGELGQLE